MTFGEKLKKLRQGNEKTQEAVANAVGLNKRSIVMYEMGKTMPRFEWVYEKLAEYFGVPVELLKNDSSDDFENIAYYSYGAKAKREADRLVTEISGLFAGGDLRPEDRDSVMRALERAYWDIVEEEKKNKN